MYLKKGICPYHIDCLGTSSDSGVEGFSCSLNNFLQLLLTLVEGFHEVNKS